MISIDSWPGWLAISVIGGPILLSAVGLVCGLYLNRRHLDALQGADPFHRDAFWYMPGRCLLALVNDGVAAARR